MRIRSSTIHPRGSASAASKRRHAVMIECAVCEHAAYSTVEYVESEALINGGLVSRPCHRCGTTTMWKQFDLPPAASIV